MDDISPWLFVGLIVLVAFSAYFSASETAFSTLNKIRIKNYANNGDKRAKTALRIAEEYDRTISTILIGNNAVNTAAASIGTLICTSLFGAGGVGIATLCMTVVILLFGEISPKSIAKDYAEGFALSTGGFLQLLIWILWPLNMLFLGWKKLLSHVFKKSGRSPAITEDELKVIVDEIESEGTLNKQESELIRSAIEFNDIAADDILTPRVDCAFAPEDISSKELKELFRSTGFSRIPVYGEDIDDIIGIVYEKDFYNSDNQAEDFAVKTLLKQPIFVPYNMKISLLLTTLQKSKAHMAIVVDQYGGNMGLVTMEDVLEELVGEIWDESDQVVSPVEKQSDGTYLAQGAARFADVLEELGLPYDEDAFKSNSIGGYMAEALGRIPKEGDQTVYGGWTLSAVKVDGKRVQKIRLSPPPAGEQP